jgi:flagellar operon protein
MTYAAVPVQPSSPVAQPRQADRKPAVGGAEFAQHLDEQLRISGHAAKRMESRGVELGGTDIDRLSGAVDQAEAKGSSEALILMDGVAFVVSVPNRTVITAHSGPGDRVYTNIDSTIVLAGEARANQG